jgi:hypothetical protein
MDSQKIQSYFLEKRLEVLNLADMGCHGTRAEEGILLHLGASRFLRLSADIIMQVQVTKVNPCPCPCVWRALLKIKPLSKKYQNQKGRDISFFSWSRERTSITAARKLCGSTLCKPTSQSEKKMSDFWH